MGALPRPVLNLNSSVRRRLFLVGLLALMVAAALFTPAQAAPRRASAGVSPGSGVSDDRAPGEAASADALPIASADSVSGDAAAPAARPFRFEDVVEKARTAAEAEYVPPAALPASLRSLNYDQWRTVRFKPERSLWRFEKLPFELQFFHSGFYYDRNVEISIIEEDGNVVPVPFSTDLFQYPNDDLRSQVATSNVGFAGFRVHCAINDPGYKDEVVVFLGASYFRAVGKDTKYGLSARGLALDTALPSGEEFPWFREFWVGKPSGGDASITVYALLDSPSCTGAYRFVISPGPETVMREGFQVFLRKGVEKVGIAPLTSMYFYGAPENGRLGDYRPEVHDSDGLLVHRDDDLWQWRALRNGERLSTTRIPVERLLGFGLLQRNRNFDRYQDLEADYERRPSLWVEPDDDWGSGRIELIEIPTDSEYNDNIVAFWVPNREKPDSPIKGACRLRWGEWEKRLHPLGRVVGTHQARGDRKNWVRFLVDFEGGELDALPEDSGITSVVEVDGAKLVQKHLEKNPHTGGWRLSFQVEVDAGGGFSVFPAIPPAVHLSAVLKKGENLPNPLTETWTYVFGR